MNPPEIFPCKRCSELFFYKNEMEDHCKLCSPKKCPKCPNRYFSAELMQNHICRQCIVPKLIERKTFKTLKQVILIDKRI